MIRVFYIRIIFKVLTKMSKIYVLLTVDVGISDLRVFADHKEALKAFLISCIHETQCLLEDENVSILSSSHGDETTHILQFMELDEGGEYKVVKDFDVNDFQEMVGDQDDVEDYLTKLSEELEEKVPDNLVEFFK